MPRFDSLPLIALRKISMKRLTFLALSILSVGANAGVIYEDNTKIKVTGQSYHQSVLLDSTQYQDVSLSLFAKGDYGEEHNAYIQFFIDDVLLADWNFMTPSIDSTENFRLFDYSLSSTIEITESQWDLFSSDGLLNISWQNGYGVNPYHYNKFGGKDFVSFTLSASPVSVPEPSTLLLLGLGIAALGISRRRMF